MDHPAPPNLSVIVPTYNEATTLPTLLASLREQVGVHFELILVDGGSEDATIAIAERFAAESRFPVGLIKSKAGRGRQFNAGAERAAGANLLFLHADSRFSDSNALANGLFALDRAIAVRGNHRLAGHFALCFDCSGDSLNRGYLFYQCKARLHRAGCLHGDQGFLVRRAFFQEIGPFDTALPFLEDEYFAAAVGKCGEWVLLPAEIHTSARRFETEGLFRRQVLNALIMNAVAIGWTQFLQQAPVLYRRQSDAGQLDLLPFFQGLRDLFRGMPRNERLRTWYAAGTYVRNNAWQLLFAVDVWLGLRRTPSFRGEQTPVLDRFERCFDRCTDHPAGRLLTAGLVWAWFQVTLAGLEISKRLQVIFPRKGRSDVAGRN